MRFGIVLVLALGFAQSGCQNLDPIEEAQYDQLMAEGKEPMTKKSPALAACLNLLPGFGDIYTGEAGAFVLDFLLWWPSVAWAVPQAWMTASNINKKYTIACNRFGAGRDGSMPGMAPPNSAP